MTQNKYLQALIALFHQEVKEMDSRPVKHTYEDEVLYSKWISTVEASEFLNEPVCKVRAELTRLEKEGKVTARRASNWITWAAKDIPGFKQHQFNDYYCKDEITFNLLEEAPFVFHHILSWFETNYNESVEECEQLLIDAIRKSPYSILDLFIACYEFKKASSSKQGLSLHLSKIKELSLVGYKASVAGIELRKRLLEELHGSVCC